MQFFLTVLSKLVQLVVNLDLKGLPFMRHRLRGTFLLDQSSVLTLAMISEIQFKVLIST